MIILKRWVLKNGSTLKKKNNAIGVCASAQSSGFRETGRKNEDVGQGEKGQDNGTSTDVHPVSAINHHSVVVRENVWRIATGVVKIMHMARG